MSKVLAPYSGNYSVIVCVYDVHVFCVCDLFSLTACFGESSENAIQMPPEQRIKHIGKRV